MSNMSKSAQRGKCIAKIGHLTICQKNNNEEIKTESKTKIKKFQTKSTEIAIYNGKKLVEKPFKNKEAAVKRAEEIMKKHLGTTKNEEIL